MALHTPNQKIPGPEACVGATMFLLSDAADHYTLELVGGSHDIDRFLKRTAQVADVVTLVRSGAMAVMRGGAAFKRS